MPLKRVKDEIEKFWIAKVTNPEVIKTRFIDVRDLQVKLMKRSVSLMTPINEQVSIILDRHGISGSKRLDYYNFARRAFRMYYEKSGEVADRYYKGTYDYFKRSVDLNEDIMDEIGKVVKELAEIAKAEDKAREEREKKSLLLKNANIEMSGENGNKEIRDNSPS